MSKQQQMSGFTHRKELKNGIIIDFSFSKYSKTINFSLKGLKRNSSRAICGVSSTSSVRDGEFEDPQITWMSWGECSPEVAYLFAEALKYAAEIANNIEGHPWVVQARRDGERV